MYETSRKSELILLNLSAPENMRAVLRKNLIEEWKESQIQKVRKIYINDEILMLMDLCLVGTIYGN